MKNVSFMSDFLTPSNLKALNLGQPPYYYIPRGKSGIYWIQVRRAAAAVEISLWTR